ncbi:hypothetical protein HK101_010661 [Irineochytrium annulatum]|nr:hypothetical protein HK101_010661 [Irineochytrium annulatum]
MWEPQAAAIVAAVPYDGRERRRRKDYNPTPSPPARALAAALMRSDADDDQDSADFVEGDRIPDGDEPDSDSQDERDEESRSYRSDDRFETVSSTTDGEDDLSSDETSPDATDATPPRSVSLEQKRKNRNRYINGPALHAQPLAGTSPSSQGSLARYERFAPPKHTVPAPVGVYRQVPAISSVDHPAFIAKPASPPPPTSGAASMRPYNPTSRSAAFGLAPAATNGGTYASAMRHQRSPPGSADNSPRGSFDSVRSSSTARSRQANNAMNAAVTASTPQVHQPEPKRINTEPRVATSRPTTPSNGASATATPTPGSSNSASAASLATPTLTYTAVPATIASSSSSSANTSTTSLQARGRRSAFAQMMRDAPTLASFARFSEQEHCGESLLFLRRLAGIEVSLLGLADVMEDADGLVMGLGRALDRFVGVAGGEEEDDAAGGVGEEGPGGDGLEVSTWARVEPLAALFRDFLADDAPLELNVSGGVKRGVRAWMDELASGDGESVSATTGAFDRAADHVLDMIYRDVFPRFCAAQQQQIGRGRSATDVGVGGARGEAIMKEARKRDRAPSLGVGAYNFDGDSSVVVTDRGRRRGMSESKPVGKEVRERSKSKSRFNFFKVKE